MDLQSGPSFEFKLLARAFNHYGLEQYDHRASTKQSLHFDNYYPWLDLVDHLALAIWAITHMRNLLHLLTESVALVWSLVIFDSDHIE